MDRANGTQLLGTVFLPLYAVERDRLIEWLSSMPYPSPFDEWGGCFAAARAIECLQSGRKISIEFRGLEDRPLESGMAVETEGV